MIYVVLKGVVRLMVVGSLCLFAKTFAEKNTILTCEFPLSVQQQLRILMISFNVLLELPYITGVARKPRHDTMTRCSALGFVTRHAWGLTFAGVGGRARPPRIPVEAGLALLTLPPFRVVQTVAHASAALSGLTPRRPVKMAALGMTIALALWRGMEEMNISGTGRLLPVATSESPEILELVAGCLVTLHKLYT